MANVTSNQPEIWNSKEQPKEYKKFKQQQTRTLIFDEQPKEFKKFKQQLTRTLKLKVLRRITKQKPADNLRFLRKKAITSRIINNTFLNQKMRIPRAFFDKQFMRTWHVKVKKKKKKKLVAVGNIEDGNMIDRFGCSVILRICCSWLASVRRH